MFVNCFRGNIRVSHVDLIDTTPQGIKNFMNLNHLDYITGDYYPIAIKNCGNIFICEKFLKENKRE